MDQENEKRIVELTEICKNRSKMREILELTKLVGNELSLRFPDGHAFSIDKYLPKVFTALKVLASHRYYGQIDEFVWDNYKIKYNSPFYANDRWDISGSLYLLAKNKKLCDLAYKDTELYLYLAKKYVSKQLPSVDDVVLRFCPDIIIENKQPFFDPTPDGILTICQKIHGDINKALNALPTHIYHEIARQAVHNNMTVAKYVTCVTNSLSIPAFQDKLTGYQRSISMRAKRLIELSSSFSSDYHVVDFDIDKLFEKIRDKITFTPSLSWTQEQYLLSKKIALVINSKLLNIPNKTAKQVVDTILSRKESEGKKNLKIKTYNKLLELYPLKIMVCADTVMNIVPIRNNIRKWAKEDCVTSAVWLKENFGFRFVSASKFNAILNLAMLKIEAVANGGYVTNSTTHHNNEINNLYDYYRNNPGQCKNLFNWIEAKTGILYLKTEDLTFVENAKTLSDLYGNGPVYDLKNKDFKLYQSVFSMMNSKRMIKANWTTYESVMNNMFFRQLNTEKSAVDYVSVVREAVDALIGKDNLCDGLCSLRFGKEGKRLFRQVTMIARNRSIQPYDLLKEWGHLRKIDLEDPDSVRLDEKDRHIAYILQNLFQDKIISRSIANLEVYKQMMNRTKKHKVQLSTYIKALGFVQPSLVLTEHDIELSIKAYLNSHFPDKIIREKFSLSPIYSRVTQIARSKNITVGKYVESLGFSYQNAIQERRHTLSNMKKPHNTIVKLME